MNLHLRVYGKEACYTNPHFPTNRISYPIPTPSVCRAVFEAIFFKKEFSYRVSRIVVMKPIKYLSLRTNERTLDLKRTQRSNRILVDVDYLITAAPHSWSPNENPHQKYRDMFRRRATKGQCRRQPYFGIREHTAMFELIEDDRPYLEAAAKVHPGRVDFDVMLYDVFDRDGPPPNQVAPTFFKPTMIDGVVNIPDYSTVKR